MGLFPLVGLFYKLIVTQGHTWVLVGPAVKLKEEEGHQVPSPALSAALLQVWSVAAAAYGFKGRGGRALRLRDEMGVTVQALPHCRRRAAARAPLTRRGCC